MSSGGALPLAGVDVAPLIRAGRARRPAGRVTAGLAAAGLVAAACGGGGGGAGTERTLVLGYHSELQTLNPLASTDTNANELIYWLLFTPLVEYDSAASVRPGLAESWELGEREVVFRLRDDVRWHDGRPVTAADVVFTFERAKDPRTASPLASAYLTHVDSARALGDLEVRFVFGAPHAEPLEDFFWPPVPRHLLEDVPPEELARHTFGRAPVGSGPYRFVSWEVSQRLVFEANPEYAVSLGGPPPIRRVIYRIVPEPTTLLAEFLAGHVHVLGPLAPADAGRVEAAAGVRLHAFPWRQFSYVGWNGRRPPLDSRQVRRALTLAIDRRSLVDATLAGYGRVAAGPIPPWHRYAPSLEPLPYDPDSAAALLDRAGWRDADGDGIRERDGRRLRIELLANQRNPIYGDVAQVLQAQLRRVGVEVAPRLLEQQTVLARHRAREFDAVLTNWVLDNFRVDPRPLFHGSQAAIENSANRSSYANPVADSLMDLGSVTLDTTRAREIWASLARLLHEDQPLTFLFWQDELAGSSEALEGVRMDARGELVTIRGWRWRGEAR